MLDTKNFSPAFLVIEEHVHYMKVWAIEIFTIMQFDERTGNTINVTNKCAIVIGHNEKFQQFKLIHSMVFNGPLMVK